MAVSHVDWLIAEIEVGDEVATIDPASGQRSAQPVLDVIVGHGTKHLVDINLDGNASTVLTATAQHPIWVVGAGWIDAAEIRPGDQLLSYSRSTVAVRSVHDRGYVAEQTVYNLNVGNVHTYLVSADDHDVLVHNCSFLRNAWTTVKWQAHKFNRWLKGGERPSNAKRVRRDGWRRPDVRR